MLALVCEQPVHGFAVARAMAPGGDVGRVWAMRRPLVYRTLVWLDVGDPAGNRLYITKSWRATGGLRFVLSDRVVLKAEYLNNGEYGGIPQIKFYNRDGFFIHGRGKHGSDGCVVPQIPAQRTQLNKAIRQAAKGSVILKVS